TDYLAGVQERLREAELQRTAAEAREEEAQARVAAEAQALRLERRARRRAKALAAAEAQALRLERRARRRTKALAAVLLALVVAVAGGILWFQRQQTERRQAVETALDKVAELQRQARWKEAEAVLDQADARLGPSGPDDLRRRLAQARTDL